MKLFPHQINCINAIDSHIKKNVNYLQKFIAECYNNVIEDIINITLKKKKIKNNDFFYYEF